MRCRTAVALTVATVSLAACGGDDTPLPPLVVSPQWMPLVVDTAGNIAMRRMGMWVDTANVTTSPAGYALTAQRMHVDMKIGGMTTSMQMRTEIDCAGKRIRVIGLDSMTASVKGVALPDSVARKAMADQSAKASTDTTWKAATDGLNATMVTAVCAKVAAAPAAPAPAATAPAP
jgi:hypothetical protein